MKHEHKYMNMDSNKDAGMDIDTNTDRGMDTEHIDNNVH
jgi:hypothetical protein